MATFVEALGLLNYFSVIFPMILVFAIMYAILQKTKIFGEHMTTVNVIVAIASAFMLILFPDLVELIKVMTPWFVIVFVFLAFLLTLYLLAGQSEDSIAAYIRRDQGMNYIILAVGLLIVLGSAGIVWGQKLLPIAGQSGTPTIDGAPVDEFQANILATFFNPKILGMVVIFVIAIFTIILLSSTPPGAGGGGGGGGHGGGHH